MTNLQKLDRKQRKELMRRVNTDDPGLEIVHPNAAGIDVGNASHYVAISPRRDPEPVRQFGCFTEDLRRLAEWLKSRGVDTVAMQSTGVYGIPLYDILEEYGMEVFLVNAKHTRNLPGRKTDVQESPWLLKLHTYGLLHHSFRPPAEILTLRTSWRLRAEQVRGASSAIQRMQKVLTQMNVQLANVISDISGRSGMAIIRAILAGERNPEQLAALCHPRIQATPEEVTKSLEGNGRAELLFAPEQEVNNYDHYQRQMAACDQKLQIPLGSFPTRKNKNPKGAGEPSLAKRRAKKRSTKSKRNAPVFDLTSELQRITGVDLTLLDGVDVMTAQTIISEVGWDMSRWKTEAHLASWLGLCPNNKITGGKVHDRGTRHVENRAATVFRMAATSLWRSKTYLGAKFKRLRANLGVPKAITAIAHTLARLVYRMLKYGQDYVDKGVEFYQRRYQQQHINWMQKKAKGRCLTRRWR